MVIGNSSMSLLVISRKHSCKSLSKIKTYLVQTSRALGAPLVTITCLKYLEGNINI